MFPTYSTYNAYNTPAPISPDTTTNEATAFQTWLDAGGEHFTSVHYINSPIIIRPQKRLSGLPAGELFPKTAALNSLVGTLIIGPSGSITMQQSSELRNVNIISLDASTNPSSISNGASRIAAWTGTGVTITGQDATVAECFIVGFAKGIFANNERWNIYGNRIDCRNGLEFTTTNDVGRCVDNHLWPFWLVHRFDDPSGAGVVPYQKGIYVHDTADGCLFRGNFMYGFLVGLHIKAVYSCDFEGIWIDNNPNSAIRTIGGVSNPTVGVMTEGGVTLCRIRGVHVDSHSKNFQLTHTSGSIVVDGCTSSNSQALNLQLGVGHGTITNFEMGATAGSSEVVFDNPCGQWVLDDIGINESVSTNPFSIASAWLSRVNIGRVTFRGGTATINPRAFISTVDVKSSADQVLPAGVLTVISYGTTVEDSWGEWNGTEFTTRLGGLFQVNVSFGFTNSSATDSYAYFEVQKNSVSVQRIYQDNRTTIALCIGSGSVTLQLAANDKVRIVAGLEHAGTLMASRNIVRIAPLPTTR